MQYSDKHGKPNQMNGSYIPDLDHLPITCYPVSGEHMMCDKNAHLSCVDGAGGIYGERRAETRRIRPTSGNNIIGLQVQGCRSQSDVNNALDMDEDDDNSSQSFTNCNNTDSSWISTPFHPPPSSGHMTFYPASATPSNVYQSAAGPPRLPLLQGQQLANAAAASSETLPPHIYEEVGPPSLQPSHFYHRPSVTHPCNQHATNSATGMISNQQSVCQCQNSTLLSQYHNCSCNSCLSLHGVALPQSAAIYHSPNVNTSCSAGLSAQGMAHSMSATLATHQSNCNCSACNNLTAPSLYHATPLQIQASSSSFCSCADCMTGARQVPTMSAGLYNRLSRQPSGQCLVQTESSDINTSRPCLHCSNSSAPLYEQQVSTSSRHTRDMSLFAKTDNRNSKSSTHPIVSDSSATSSSVSASQGRFCCGHADAASSTTTRDNKKAGFLVGNCWASDLCNRNRLIVLGVVLLLIVVISIAAGLITDTVIAKSNSETAVGDRVSLSSKLTGSVTVVNGVNSEYSAALSDKSSPQYQFYASAFSSQILAIFNQANIPLRVTVNDTLVDKLRPGDEGNSVIIDFEIHLSRKLNKSSLIRVADSLNKALHVASNRTGQSQTIFSTQFPLDLSSILICPSLSNCEDTTRVVSTPAPPRMPPTIPTSLVSQGSSPASSKPQSTTTTTAPANYMIAEESGVCEPIKTEICQQIYYNDSGTTFPNFAGHTTQEQAIVTITVMNAIMATTSCYDHLNTFSCALLAPQCGPENKRIPPCRSLCEAAFSRCSAYMKVVMETTSANIDCSYFPDDSSPSNKELCVTEEVPVVPTAPPSCPDNFFSCDDRKCHAMKDRCDSVTDCQDGTDEQGCEQFACIEGQFSCANGTCIPKVWNCDGHNDCRDWSDEENCEPVPPCQVGEFKCANGHDVWGADDDPCIEGKFTCDATNDCSDASDEDPSFCRNRSSWKEQP